MSSVRVIAPNIFQKYFQLRNCLQLCNYQTSAVSGRKFDLPDRYKGCENSVWVEYIALALQHKPLNLGQGFPDYAPPEHVTRFLSDVINETSNVLIHQYTRGFGHPRLINAVSKLYSHLIGRYIDPFTEVLISSGAYEALYSAIMGHISPGDEVVIIEPFYDCFEAMVLAAGGTPVFIPLKPVMTTGNITSADWKLDEEHLRSVFNDKTKLMILNNPQNPIGKVYTRQELELIAELCMKWDVLCLCDEVYEWIVYKPHKHIRIATLPGMWERTITAGSAGKTFSVTGWKTGWAYGPANLMRNLQVVHQNCIYACPTPFQEAIARAFELEISRFDSPDCYMKSISEELEPKRAFVTKMLEDVGMKPVLPDGGYFVVADWSPLEDFVNINEEKDVYKDYRFTKWMTKNVGVQGIPVSAFYSPANKSLAENFVRYCFIKSDENLATAANILKKWRLESRNKMNNRL